jgi:hypothetical protein
MSATPDQEAGDPVDGVAGPEVVVPAEATPGRHVGRRRGIVGYNRDDAADGYRVYPAGELDHR